MKRIRLCKTSDIPVNKAIRVMISNELDLAVFHIGNDFWVTDDTCTHGPASLSEGIIAGDVVRCDFHNGACHIPSGRPVALPCDEQLKTYPVIIEDDDLFIEVGNTTEDSVLIEKL
jgi:nitrite reductase/ring-hydroxylating ferredoxin subunit